MRKGLFALVILATIVAAAPDAMADHCFQCFNSTCFPTSGSGRAICDDSGTRCVLAGSCSGVHPFVEVEEPLAATFVVASVERLDEPQRPSDEPRVASLETTQPTAQR